VRRILVDLETRLNDRKSTLVKEVAERLGLPVIEVKMAKVHHGDLVGSAALTGLETAEEIYDMLCPPVSKRVFNEVVDNLVGEQMVGSDIVTGDMVLMEYAKGVLEAVVVQEIIDGTVYGVGEDGEPFCAPLAHCDKVPF
jgi:hypothetical protein